MKLSEYIESGSGIVRIISGLVAVVAIAWVISVSISGPSGIAQLEQFEEQAASMSVQYRAEVRQELQDAVLAEDGWGEGASVVDSSEQSYADIARDARAMLDERDGDWGVGSQ